MKNPANGGVWKGLVEGSGLCPDDTHGRHNPRPRRSRACGGGRGGHALHATGCITRPWQMQACWPCRLPSYPCQLHGRQRAHLPKSRIAPGQCANFVGRMPVARAKGLEIHRECVRRARRVRSITGQLSPGVVSARLIRRARVTPPPSCGRLAVPWPVWRHGIASPASIVGKTPGRPPQILPPRPGIAGRAPSSPGWQPPSTGQA